MADKRLHLGSNGDEGEGLTPICRQPCEDGHAMLSPTMPEAEQKAVIDAARSTGVLCPSCEAIMGAYAQGFSEGQQAVMEQLNQPADIVLPEGKMYFGHLSEEVH